MTAADQLIERGLQQGLERGREQERREMLLSLLQARFGSLPDRALERVTTATMSTLQTWSLRVLTASGLDDVLGTD